MHELDPYSLNYVKVFESYRLTDRQTESTEIMNHAASLVVNNSACLYDRHFCQDNFESIDMESSFLVNQGTFSG